MWITFTLSSKAHWKWRLKNNKICEDILWGIFNRAKARQKNHKLDTRNINFSWNIKENFKHSPQFLNKDTVLLSWSVRWQVPLIAHPLTKNICVHSYSATNFANSCMGLPPPDWDVSWLPLASTWSWEFLHNLEWSLWFTSSWLGRILAAFSQYLKLRIPSQSRMISMIYLLLIGTYLGCLVPVPEAENSKTISNDLPPPDWDVSWLPCASTWGWEFHQNP
jgi:hypothetical protein